jgi:hypothetical protein
VIVGAWNSDRVYTFLGGTASGTAAMQSWTNVTGTTFNGRFVSYAGFMNSGIFTDFLVGNCSPDGNCGNSVRGWYGNPVAPTGAMTPWLTTGANGHGLGSNR